MPTRPSAILLALILVAGCGGTDSAADPTTSTAPASPTTIGDQMETPSTTPTPSSTPASSTTASDASNTTTSTTPPDDGIERARGTGTLVLDGEARDVEVIACGWLAAGGGGEPLESEPNSRNDFRLTLFERVGDTVLVFDLDRDGVVGVAFVNVLQAVVGSGADDPRNFLWGNDRQSVSLVEIDGASVATVKPLTILEAPADRSSPAHEVGFVVECSEFGGIPDEFADLVATVAGVELPEFGASGVVTIDGTEYDITTMSCSLVGGVEGVAESPSDDLVVSVVDLGTDVAGILSDTVGIDIGDRSLVADEDVDIVIDGTVLRTAAPVQLYDLFTREPAGVATVAIDCG